MRPRGSSLAGGTRHRPGAGLGHPEIVMQRARAGIPAAIVLSPDSARRARRRQGAGIATAGRAREADVAPRPELRGHAAALDRPERLLRAHACEAREHRAGVAVGRDLHGARRLGRETKVGRRAWCRWGAAIDVDFGRVLDYLALRPEDGKRAALRRGRPHGRAFISSLRPSPAPSRSSRPQGGRYASGSQAARSHTGALVGNDAGCSTPSSPDAAWCACTAPRIFSGRLARCSRRKPRAIGWPS